MRLPRRTLPVAVAAALLATACGGPSPSPVTLTVVASAQVNPNTENQPSPIVLRFYDLKSLDTFNGATFFDLYDNDAKKLGADMLGRREIEVQPGKTTKMTYTAVPEALYVGVIAGFRDLENAQWRDVFTLSAGDSNAILVTLQARSVALTRPRSRFLGIF